MAANKPELFIYMVLQQWQATNQKIDKFFDTLSEEQYAAPIAGSPNTASWVLCHLAHVSDRLFPLLGLGNAQYPQLAEVMEAKNSSPHTAFSKSEAKNMWLAINAKLFQHFTDMSPEQWFEKHTAVSEDDFKKEPHRNKLNVIINRTNHQSHHIGQLVLIK